MSDLLRSYETLGLPQGASPKALKKAYRDLVKKWHPDRFGDRPEKRAEAEERIKQINLAFQRIQKGGDLHELARKARQAHQRAKATQARPRSQTNPRPQSPPPRPGQHRSDHKRPGASRAGPARSSQPSPGPLQPHPVILWMRGLRVHPRAALSAFGSAMLLAVIIWFWPSPREPSPVRRGPLPPTPSLSELDSMILSNRTTVAPATGADLETNAPSELTLASILPAGGAHDAKNLDGGQPGLFGPGRASFGDVGPGASPGNDLLERAGERVDSSQRAAQAQAHFEEGSKFAKGDGVTQDYAEAARLYQLAAESGHAEAQRNLGLLYATGKGVEQDMAEADQWFQKAAQEGDATARLASGVSLLSQTAAERQKQEQLMARDLQSKQVLMAEAERNYQLGLEHARGQGAAPDFQSAARHYRLAAELGHTNAQKRLGFLYAEGKGVPKDLEEAKRWLEKATPGSEGAPGLATSLISLMQKRAEENSSRPASSSERKIEEKPVRSP